MQFRDDDELFSIGTVAIEDPCIDHDTTSDVSDWVLQYADWEEGTVQFGFTPSWADPKVGPVFQASITGRTAAVAPICHFVLAE